MCGMRRMVWPHRRGVHRMNRRNGCDTPWNRRMRQRFCVERSGMRRTDAKDGPTRQLKTHLLNPAYCLRQVASASGGKIPPHRCSPTVEILSGAAEERRLPRRNGPTAAAPSGPAATEFSRLPPAAGSGTFTLAFCHGWYRCPPQASTAPSRRSHTGPRPDVVASQPIAVARRA
jgi:hypothetical protein